MIRITIATVTEITVVTLLCRRAAHRGGTIGGRAIATSDHWRLLPIVVATVMLLLLLLLLLLSGLVRMVRMVLVLLGV